MRNTRTSLKQYHFTKFCVAILIPTEDICVIKLKMTFSSQNRKLSAMHPKHACNRSIQREILSLVSLVIMHVPKAFFSNEIALKINALCQNTWITVIDLSKV